MGGDRQWETEEDWRLRGEEGGFALPEMSDLTL